MFRFACLFVALAIIPALSSACSVVTDRDPWCPPVDEGGDCFRPSEAAFKAHALQSATAWPQLRGLPITAGQVIEGFDEVAGQPTWVVPLLAEGRVVAASRFLPFEGFVRLGEVALYQPPRLDFPIPNAGERFVLSAGPGCSEPGPEACLFSGYRWRLDR